MRMTLAEAAIPLNLNVEQLKLDLQNLDRMLGFLIQTPGTVFLHGSPGIWITGNAISAGWYDYFRESMAKYGIKLADKVAITSAEGSTAAGVALVGKLAIPGQQVALPLAQLKPVLDVEFARRSRRRAATKVPTWLWYGLALAGAIGVGTILANQGEA